MKEHCLGWQGTRALIIIDAKLFIEFTTSALSSRLLLASCNKRVRGGNFEEVHVTTRLEKCILSVIETVTVGYETSDLFALLTYLWLLAAEL